MVSEITPKKITETFLSRLGNDELIDLLNNHTRLLLTAARCQLPDKVYITSLTLELKKIQAEIQARKS
jgi:hypothetical protein